MVERDGTGYPRLPSSNTRLPRPPPRMRPPLADQRLDLSVQLTGLMKRPVGMVSQPR